jgi:AhpD family alkylhydroperoxidase
MRVDKNFCLPMSHAPAPSRHVVRANKRNLAMTAKLDLFAATPSLMKTWMGTSLAIVQSLDPALAELVEIRASQINGCANCINMHTTSARKRGESEQRIYLLSAWREAPCYTERERAALGWTDALTRLPEGPDYEAAYGALKAQFSEEERVKLTLLINCINGWNRLAVGFGLWIDPEHVEAMQKVA